MLPKVVICGAGFLGTTIAKRMLNATNPLTHTPAWRVQCVSRNPERVHKSVVDSSNPEAAARLDPPRSLDITKPGTLHMAFDDAEVVVSAVGILTGSPKDFERVQWRGAENIARAAHAAGAKLIHISAIGADPDSPIPYARTKGLGERAVLDVCPDATIIRPSIVFGPGDGFFGRFATLSKVLPFMPAFGGGHSLFQPVYVEDIARLIETISRHDPAVADLVDCNIIEAGGPDVFTYRQIMELVREYTGRWRPIIPVPFSVGLMQASILERLPSSIFTLTCDQVEQLKQDNVVTSSPTENHCNFKHILEVHAKAKLTSVREILPTYLPSV